MPQIVPKSDSDLENIHSIDLKQQMALTSHENLWILIGCFITFSSFGVFMLVRFLAEGYKKKSQQTGLITVMTLVILILLYKIL